MRTLGQLKREYEDLKQMCINLCETLGRSHSVRYNTFTLYAKFMLSLIDDIQLLLQRIEEVENDNS